MLQDTFEFALGVKHVKAHGHCLTGDGLGRLALRASSGICQLHSALKSLAPIGDDVLQARPVGDHLAPALPATIWTPLACHPRHAVRFDRHQNRRTVQEDFVETEHPHARLTGQIEYHKKPPSPRRRLLHPATYHGPTGDSAQRQHDGEQRDDLAETQTHGTAGAREGALLGLTEVLGFRPRLPQRGVFCLEPLVFLPKGVVTEPARVCARNSLYYALGMRVDGGATRATLLRPPRTAPQGPLRTAAALLIQVAMVTFNTAVSLHDPSWVRLGSLIMRLTCFKAV